VSQTPGARGRVEEGIRKAWNTRPGGFLSLLSASWAAGAAGRNLLYDSGILARRRAPIPVVSVGGLTVGGSGKTPIVADLAIRLSRLGVRTAIVTHGFQDEIEVHRRLCPEAGVYGGRDRRRQAIRAAADGAQIALLDSGFQHRRLHRDLDIVALDEPVIRTRPRHLPAGPFREGLPSLARADLVVVVTRSPVDHGGAPEGGLGLVERAWPALRELADLPGAPPFVSARIRPGPLVPANESARGISQPEPAVAVAGIMWPDVFFTQAKHVAPSVRDTVRLSDHSRIDDRLGVRLGTMAGEAGIACTLKDERKLVRVLRESVPIWYLSEEVFWEGDVSPPTAVRAALGLLDGAYDGFAHGRVT
jgi:tetraacyldisaccharide 4'-kinase